MNNKTIDPEKIARCEAAMKELLQEIMDKFGISRTIITANMKYGNQCEFLSVGFGPDWHPTLAGALTEQDQSKAKLDEAKRIENKIKDLQQLATRLREEASEIQH